MVRRGSQEEACRVALVIYHSEILCPYDQTLDLFREPLRSSPDEDGVPHVLCTACGRCRTRCTSGATRAAASTSSRRASRSTRAAAAQVRVCSGISATVAATCFLRMFSVPSALLRSTARQAPLGRPVDEALSTSLLSAAWSTGRSARFCQAVVRAMLPGRGFHRNCNFVGKMLASVSLHWTR